MIKEIKGKINGSIIIVAMLIEDKSLENKIVLKMDSSKDILTNEECLNYFISDINLELRKYKISLSEDDVKLVKRFEYIK